MDRGGHFDDEPALYIGLFGFPFEVHEPPELVAHVRELAERGAAGGQGMH